MGAAIVQAGHDYGQLGPMKKQVEERLEHTVSEILVDPGYLENKDVDEVSKTSRVYTPTETVNINNKKYPFISEMKSRMETAGGKEIYKESQQLNLLMQG